MNATNPTNVSPVDSIINGVMRDATTADNRQAELTVAMFNAEVTYTAKIIIDTFNKEGAERTAAIDNLLCDASSEFDHVVGKLDHLKEHMKAAKKNDDTKTVQSDAFQIEGLNKKARAARMMFTRALYSVLWLREKKCRTIATNKIGSGALLVKLTDPEDDTGSINEKVSCTQLAARGEKHFRDSSGKAKKPSASARNPAANVLADASKSLAAVLSSMASDGKRKPMSDFDDAVEHNMEATLKELFAMRFFDGDKLDRKSLNEWIDSTFKPVAKDAPKQEAPKQNGKKEEAAA